MVFEKYVLIKVKFTDGTNEKTKKIRMPLYAMSNSTDFDYILQNHGVNYIEGIVFSDIENATDTSSNQFLNCTTKGTGCKMQFVGETTHELTLFGNISETPDGTVNAYHYVAVTSAKLDGNDYTDMSTPGIAWYSGLKVSPTFINQIGPHTYICTSIHYLCYYEDTLYLRRTSYINGIVTACEGRPTCEIDGSGHVSNADVGMARQTWEYSGSSSSWQTYNVGGTRYQFNEITPADLEDWVESTDPFDGGGTSDEGGGSGTFTRTSDSQDFPPLPTLDISATGLVTLYAPHIPALNNIKSYLWGSAFDLDNLKKMYQNPMDCIIAFLAIPDTVPTAGTTDFVIGNVNAGFQITKANGQYYYIDCGSVSVTPYSDTYLDYSTLTDVSIYLPYIGIRPLKTNDIMNSTIHVKYMVDILTGGCTAFLKVTDTKADHENKNVSKLLYTFNGNCGVSLPLYSTNYSGLYSTILSTIGSVGAGLATGGISSLPSMAMGAVNGAVNGVSTAVNSAINKNQVSVERAGSFGGTLGIMGQQKPYLIISWGRQCLPSRQNTFTGYPTYITDKLNTFAGFTVVDEIHYKSMPATKQELDELTQLLHEGVIL